MGNCVRGSMSKWGWREVTERFYAATDLVHDNEQFGNRVRQLKALWGFIQNLRNKFTGLVVEKMDLLLQVMLGGQRTQR